MFNFIHELKLLHDAIVHEDLKSMVAIVVIPSGYPILFLNCDWVLDYWKNWVLTVVILIGSDWVEFI